MVVNSVKLPPKNAVSIELALRCSSSEWILSVFRTSLEFTTAATCDHYDVCDKFDTFLEKMRKQITASRTGKIRCVENLNG